jgi:hypothetical protein
MEHFYKNIPGWFAFEALYREVVANAPQAGSLFVEVGSWQGRSAAFMGVEIINSHKDIEFVCIDPWTDGGPDLKDTEYGKSIEGKDLFSVFRDNVAPVAEAIRSMRMTSLEAVNNFDDESIDFLMLDGDHNYPVVRDEIIAYLPKMKKGGIISGDDYMWPGVSQSVEETIGSKHCGIRHVKRDRNYKLSASHWFYRVK